MGSKRSELEKYKKLFEKSEHSRKKLDDTLEQETLHRKEAKHSHKKLDNTL